MTCKIEEISPQDFPVVREILSQSTSLYPTILEWWGKVEVQLLGTLRVAFVAKAPGVCGVIVGKVKGDRVKLCSLFVEPSHRGLGVGRQLLGELVRWASQHGCHTIYFTILPSTHKTHGEFFSSMGFRCVGDTSRGDESVYAVSVEEVVEGLKRRSIRPEP